MAEVLVARRNELEDGVRKFVSLPDDVAVVFKHGDRFYALSNYCLHSGGPVGEGVIIGKVEAVLGESQRYLGEQFSADETHIVCPWHGYEYDIESGVCAGDRQRALKTYEVIERGEEVYVVH